MAAFWRFSNIREFLFLALRPWLLVRPGLDEKHVSRDPFEEFERWIDGARTCLSLEFPSAMCLSTIDPDGYPDSRYVLLKGFDRRGFCFYTNTESAKGVSLELCPRAALAFYWGPLQRQVRIQGDVVPLSSAEADAYFASRPRESRIAAWASDQSRPLANRDELDRRLVELRARFAGQEIPRPAYWSGYRLTPRRFEFWQLRLNRLHDRLTYSRAPDGSWEIRRLSP